jgi:UDP-2-acetamido-3-amino-2,3-dideoxy-glucuronate N-acetyltransferase
MASFVHASSIVEAGVDLGEDVFVGPFCHLRAGARVGRGVVLGQGCYLAPSAVVGEMCRVQNGVSLFDGVVLEGQVFVGPNCTFTNVREPRAMVDRRGAYERTFVRLGATLGANATVLSGVTIGLHAFVGAGAVVTRDVDPYVLTLGAPATARGHRSRHGAALRFVSGEAICELSGLRYVLEGGLVRSANGDDEEPWPARVRLEGP